MKLKCKCNGVLAPNAMCGNITVNGSSDCGIEWADEKEAVESCDQIELVNIEGDECEN